MQFLYARPTILLAAARMQTLPKRSLYTGYLKAKNGQLAKQVYFYTFFSFAFCPQPDRRRLIDYLLIGAITFDRSALTAAPFSR